MGKIVLISVPGIMGTKKPPLKREENRAFPAGYLISCSNS